jgi:hypothetical protein
LACGSGNRGFEESDEKVVFLLEKNREKDYMTNRTAAYAVITKKEYEKRTRCFGTELTRRNKRYRRLEKKFRTLITAEGRDPRRHAEQDGKKKIKRKVEKVVTFLFLERINM